MHFFSIFFLRYNFDPVSIGIPRCAIADLKGRESVYALERGYSRLLYHFILFYPIIFYVILFCIMFFLHFPFLSYLNLIHLISFYWMFSTNVILTLQEEMLMRTHKL